MNKEVQTEIDFLGTENEVDDLFSYEVGFALHELVRAGELHEPAFAQEFEGFSCAASVATICQLLVGHDGVRASIGLAGEGWDGSGPERWMVYELTHLGRKRLQARGYKFTHNKYDEFMKEFQEANSKFIGFSELFELTTC